MRNLLKYLFLFLVGATAYFLIETIVRGFSHPSMFILGGICFLVIGMLNEFGNGKMSLISQMLLGSVIITVLEFITGVIVNLWLKLNVWDYSGLPFNIMGQVCLLYSVFWFFISFLAILLDDFLRYKFFGEEKPKYKII